MDSRLHKSRSNRVLAGVCGGLGEYFDIDPTFVRLAFVLMAVFHGFGVLAYIVLWIVMPREESLGMNPRDSMRENVNDMRGEARRFGTHLRGTPSERGATEETAGDAGATQPFETGDSAESPRLTTPYRPADAHVAQNRQLLAGAILLILGVLFLLDNLNVFWWLSWNQTWPLILIAIGAYLLYDRSRHRPS